MNQTRRTFLLSGATAGAVAIAGCSGQSDPHKLSENPHQERVQELPRPIQGDGDSEVVVRVFEDFTCPHCKTYQDTIYPDLFENYIQPEKIRYEFYDFPLPVRPTAFHAHNAARSVQNVMGIEKYWEYSKLLFENQDSLTLQKLAALAEEIGGAGPDVVADAEDLIYHPVIENDKSIGRDNDVTGTPFVFVGWERVEELSYESLSSRIDEEL